MRRRVIASFLMAAMSIGAANAQGLVGGRMFECDVKWKGKLRDDGSFGPTDWTDLNLKAFPAFTFDEGTGVLRWKGSGNAWQYRIVQVGGDDNSLLAMRTMQGTASFVIDSLRIQTWTTGWPFMLIEQNEVSSGTCGRF